MPAGSARSSMYRFSRAAKFHRKPQQPARTAVPRYRPSKRSGAVVSTLQAYLSVVNGLSQTLTLQATYAAARRAATSNKDAFDVGVRLNIDVLNAERQAYSAYRELTKASVDTLLPPTQSEGRCWYVRRGGRDVDQRFTGQHRKLTLCTGFVY